MFFHTFSISIHFHYLKTELIQIGKVPSIVPGTQVGLTCHLTWHKVTQSYSNRAGFHQVPQREQRVLDVLPLGQIREPLIWDIQKLLSVYKRDDRNKDYTITQGSSGKIRISYPVELCHCATNHSRRRVSRALTPSPGQSG